MRKFGTATSAQAQGPRDYQEDFLVFKEGPDGILLGVMDGHVGPRAAMLCAEVIPTLFNPRRTEHPEEALRTLMAELNQQTRRMRDGTTISLVYVIGQNAYVAYLGDSPIIIVRRGGDLVVSDEHNARSNQGELDAACARGGTFDGAYLCNPRTGARLQLTRSLGDSEMGNIISREPVVFSTTLDAQSFIIVCSDGLLDPAHSNTNDLVGEAAKIVHSGGDAKTLLLWARERHLRDNATVIVWRP